MNVSSKTRAGSPAVPLTKLDPTVPALVVTGSAGIAIRAGTVFAGIAFAEETPVPLPGAGLRVGEDFVVAVDSEGRPHIRQADSLGDCAEPDVIGGFHHAPGGNAGARSGGDETPAINPFSVWDRGFRPACPDPRGMALVEKPGGRFWCDIYLLSADHLATGTSAFGATIADGASPPQKPQGAGSAGGATGRTKASGRYDGLDYATAAAVMEHHGKALLGAEDFFAATYGVTERSSCKGDPTVTGLDAPRTSRWGIMQAAGNLWIWGHDGDPDMPRASIFGGSWRIGDDAGSRYATLGYAWPVISSGVFGARGRSDHLQPE